MLSACINHNWRRATMRFVLRNLQRLASAALACETLAKQNLRHAGK
jgi:hypothetical protein